MLLTNYQVNNLDTFHDMSHTQEVITRLRAQAKKIESVCGPSLRTKKLRDEILKLENYLFCRQNPVSPSVDIYL